METYTYNKIVTDRCPYTENIKQNVSNNVIEIKPMYFFRLFVCAFVNAKSAKSA